MGQEQLTLAAIAQSFYLLLMFVGLAINKTSATLCANAIGAKNFSVVNRALKNCVLFLTLAFTCVFLLVWGVSQPLLELFLSERDFLAIETDPSLKTHCFWTLIACCFFFYFDAMAWTLQGVLIAKSDTKIIFWTSLCSFWGIVVLPLSLIVFYTNYHYAFLGWGLLTLATLVNSTVLFCRHRACPLAA